LGQTFVRLTDTLVTGYDVVELLDGLVHNCVDLLAAAAGGLLLADQRGTLQVMAASSEQTWLLELQNNEGPCLDCYRTGEPLRVEDADDQATRWPAFSSQLREHRLGAVYALPLRLGVEILGALNVFLPAGAALAELDLRIGQALADAATIAVVQHRAIRAGEEVIEQLQTALNSRIAIEQAKGVLAEYAQVRMDVAFELLRDYSRRTQQRLTDVATAIASGRVRPGTVLEAGH
jgi:transcriptional regulator with GAF, ATPase, and Fis domain